MRWREVKPLLSSARWGHQSDRKRGGASRAEAIAAWSLTTIPRSPHTIESNTRKHYLPHKTHATPFPRRRSLPVSCPHASAELIKQPPALSYSSSNTPLNQSPRMDLHNSLVPLVSPSHSLPLTLSTTTQETRRRALSKRALAPSSIAPRFSAPPTRSSVSSTASGLSSS